MPSCHQLVKLMAKDQLPLLNYLSPPESAATAPGASSVGLGHAAINADCSACRG